MADLKGNLVCSALPMTRPLNSSDEELIAINRIITAIIGVPSINEILVKVLDEALGITGLEGGKVS